MKKRFYLSVIALLMGALACNLPGGSATSPTATNAGPDAAFTLAAQTVEAELTRVALAQPTTPVPQNTSTASPAPIASATTAPQLSPTASPIPCNQASFVQDVTIPDGTSIVTNAPFTKTWRLKNTGSCTWNSSYALVFDKNEKMGGPDAQALSGSVAPGATVDISVNLTAPASAGNYRGYWRLRDGAGVLFGLSTGSFWVDIKAVAPSPTPTATSLVVLPPAIAQINAPVVAAESGSVRSDGSVLSPKNVGDTESNVSSQGFLSFDISAIPAGATITEVKVDFSDYDTLGSPFGLGCLRMYQQNYGTLDGGDYVGGSALGALSRWCNTGEVSAVAVDDDLKAVIQALVGSSRARFRVQFNEMNTNNNGVGDMVRFGNIKLIITYTP
ncbi:MAG: hypothetical protein CVU44_07520 [Chloroflexi bacterium HGW-Chloroflexi-6]|nr:MAG: hypothetical protein CVU44_07520 [Chloroflexi bacterium HGW-Chloroflexi-6]